MTALGWQQGVICQIYPRSFHLQRQTIALSWGVDAVWLSPIYPAPMADFAYDISDYRTGARSRPRLGGLDSGPVAR